MDNQITNTLITSIATISGAVITGYFAFKTQIKKQINFESEKQKNSYKKQINTDLYSLKGIDSKIIKNISDQTLEIDYADKTKLMQFVENNKIKIGLLELLGSEIPKEAYYNFAIYYAFIKQDFMQAKYYIDKSLQTARGRNIEDQNRIPLLRWAARIERLNRNEEEARKLLTEIIEIIGPGQETSNKQGYLSSLYRSRGFCYFNKGEYDGAIDDFYKALEFAEHKDIKTAYCYIGLAMSYLFKDGGNHAHMEEIKKNYAEAIKIDNWFAANDPDELEVNIRKLTDLKDRRRYYFSEREKDGIRKLVNFIKSCES